MGMYKRACEGIYRVYTGACGGICSTIGKYICRSMWEYMQTYMGVFMSRYTAVCGGICISICRYKC